MTPILLGVTVKLLTYWGWIVPLVVGFAVWETRSERESERK